MPEISLVAESGRSPGTRPSRRLRAEGKVPGVVYGQGSEPVSVAVDRRELRQALSGPAGVNAVINLEVGGTTKPTVVKSLQRDPVRRRVTHIDFLIVNLSEEITMDVPIILQGEPKAVLDAGGLLEHHLTALAVTTTPRNIPNELVVDVSGLDLGDSVRVEDITLPAGVTTSVDPDTTVVTGVATRAAVAEEAEAEGEEGEGEEGEGAGGESAAAEGGDAE
jgi:large subunit ribosomal protein L25